MQKPSRQEALTAMWTDALGAIRSVSLETIDLEVTGETACEMGRVTLEVQTPDGVITAVSKYLVSWKVEDGAWKLHRDMWNDMPA